MKQNEFNNEEEEKDFVYDIDEISTYGLDEMLTCDFGGFCSGASCPHYLQCKE